MEDAQRRFEEENTCRPFLVLTRVSLGDDWSAFEVDEKGVHNTILSKSHGYMQVELKNVGDGPACKVRMCEDSAFGIAPVMCQHRICLPSNSAHIIKFSIGQIRKHGSDSKRIDLRYENILGCGFEQSFAIDYQEGMAPSGEPEVEVLDDGTKIDTSDYEVTERLSVSALSNQTRFDSADTSRPD